jgi:hypothetical protein
MSVSEQSAATLRRDIYGRGKASKADLLRLIDAGRAAGSAGVSPAFADLVAEVATDVLVNDVDPQKYVQRADAEWLISHLSGGLAGGFEYEMLTRVIRNAVSVPPSLAAFTVAQIEKAIIEGATEHPAGVVTQADLGALRTAVYAATEDSSLHVTRESAESLFLIADATSGADANPAFEEFFAKAIGNYLMGVAFRRTPTANEAKRLERWVDSPSPGLGRFISAMFRRGDGDGDGDGVSIDAMQNEADALELAQAETIDAAEADWLLARLNRDGVISSAEKRLLRFLKEESPSIAPALQALIEKAA